MWNICCFLLLMVTNLNQVAPDPIEKASDLLKKGNAHELAKIFSSTVELSILKDEGMYSNTQAEQILDSFFKNNTPKSVTVLHEVKSNPNFRFAVLLLSTSNGVYRTSVSLKLSNSQFVLNELRIETEKK